MVSADGSTKPMPWLVPSDSTWWLPVGSRPSTTISAASPKPRILEAVREAKGEQSVQLIDHLKKGDMAREAERLLDGTGWLPEPLRLVEVDAAEQDAAGEAEALPEFLATAEDEAAADAEEEQPHSIAAE